MTEHGRKTCGKIKATKHWLNRAEQHFDQNSSVRGEMDLLLAEAELRSTRESLKSGSIRVKPFWLQHGMAFGLAVALAAVGVSSAWWMGREVPVGPVEVPAVIAPSIVEQTQKPDNVAVPAQKTEETPAATVFPTSPRQEVNSADKQAVREQQPVSPDEIKRLVRTAGQSLRGQPKK